MSLMSLAGLLFHARIYPSEELVRSYLANDAVNLVVGLPVLLGSLLLTRLGKWTGLLSWPGALLYVLYNSIAYLFGIPLGWSSAVSLSLVLLSAYLLFEILKNIDEDSVRARLAGAVPEKLAGWILLPFGIIFSFRAIGVLAEASANQAPLPISERGVLIADLAISAAWMAGGALLIRCKPLGYASGLGLLLAGSMLFAGLIVFLLLQPALTGTPFVPADAVAVFLMGLVCFIPFAIYMRGVSQVDHLAEQAKRSL